MKIESKMGFSIQWCRSAKGGIYFSFKFVSKLNCRSIHKQQTMIILYLILLLCFSNTKLFLQVSSKNRRNCWAQQKYASAHQNNRKSALNLLLARSNKTILSLAFRLFHNKSTSSQSHRNKNCLMKSQSRKS